MKALPSFYFSLILLGLSLCQPARADEVSVRVTSGTLQDTIYTIAKPTNWQGQVLLIAHGYRPEDLPLSAKLDIEQSLYADLLKMGWMLAISSYRRNGIIVGDAIEDLENLRLFILQDQGEVKRVLLMGDSMGGTIGVLIAENLFAYYDGVLVVGAALQVPDPQQVFRLNHKPQIPLLFLSNQDEAEGPANYVELAASVQNPPALWKVSRDGHVNVNDAERKAALLALNDYVSSGEIDRHRDGTIAGKHQQSTAQHGADGASGEITEITETFGNFFTSFVAADLEKLGIERKSHFHLNVGVQTVRVFWGSTYSDVQKGEWVAFISPQGNLMVSRNYENACKSTDCTVGETVLLSR